MLDLSKLTVDVRIRVPFSKWMKVMRWGMRNSIHPKLVWAMVLDHGFSILCSDEANCSGAAEG